MVILITGISSGFGKSMARQLNSDGHIVYGTIRKADERIEGVHYLTMEVTDDSSVEAAVATVLREQGRIDVLINNAGMGIGGPLEFSSIEDARKQMDVNFLGMVRVLHFVLPVMRKQKSGRIICFSSIGGLIGLPFQGLYSASKYAIEGYCEALRLEVKAFGIDVTTIEPGDFATAFTAKRQKILDEKALEAYPNFRRSMESIEHDENSGLKPDYLAKKISKVVSCRRPKHSYIIASPLQSLAVTAKRILPPRLFAWIMKLYYKL